jgi:hypothetical protein
VVVRSQAEAAGKSSGLEAIVGMLSKAAALIQAKG